MTRPYRRVRADEQAAFAAADWSTPWETAKALGARYNRAPETILIWAQRRGLAPVRRQRLVGPEDVQAVREGFAAGLLAPTIARKIGLHPETVRRIATKEGLVPGAARAHDWTDGECVRCGMRRDWPGASSPCVKAGGAS